MENAKTVCDVAESFLIAIGLLSQIFKRENEPNEDDETKSIERIRRSFFLTYSFYEKLASIEKSLKFHLIRQKLIVSRKAQMRSKNYFNY